MDIIIIQSQKKIKLSYNHIIRFFPSHKVIKVVLPLCSRNKSKLYFGDLFPSGNWFNENYINNGTFNIKENQISFKCGNDEYKGTIINDDKLILFYHSNINDYDSIEEFKFISIDVINDIKKIEEQYSYLFFFQIIIFNII